MVTQPSSLGKQISLRINSHRISLETTRDLEEALRILSSVLEVSRIPGVNGISQTLKEEEGLARVLE